LGDGPGKSDLVFDRDGGYGDDGRCSGIGTRCIAHRAFFRDLNLTTCRQLMKGRITCLVRQEWRHPVSYDDYGKKCRYDFFNHTSFYG